MRRPLRILLAAFVLSLLTPSASVAQRYDPRLRFRTVQTEHFDIHFHQEEEALAARLARIAEEVAARLERDLGRPRSRVRVILVDQEDLANGWATPVPYDLIQIEAVPPRADSTIGNTDDWLRLVFAHEYTHIVHLDRSRGWFGGLRHVFGRLPVLFPNVFLPQWQIEGIATWQESAVTGAGRVHAGDFRMWLDRAAAADRFLSLDRASGGLIDWPSGTSAYLYGGFFHDYLATRYGAGTLAELADATAGRVPYLGTPAFKKVFGRSLGDLWRDFEADTRARAARDSTAATRLTAHGFTVTAPRYASDGTLFYAVQNPHGFPALMRLDAGARPREVTSRYGGNRTAVADRLVVFDQLELVENVALQSDLYAVAADGGRTRRLTRGARAADPDVSPDGRAIVCTVQETGRRVLATLPMPVGDEAGVPVPLVVEDDTEFSSPRWSPDGRSIAAERRRLGGPSDIVLVDVETRAVRTLVSTSPARNVAPAWLPDGRAVLFSSDRDGGAFQVYRVDVVTGASAHLAGLGASAESPTVSPDGRTLAFVGYTPDGFDLFSIPLDAATWEPVSVPAAPVADARPAPSPVTAAAYSPWRTLVPTFWSPLVESDSDEYVFGAASGASDPLGRHVYYGTIGWSPSRTRPDWSLAYVYTRWWPQLFADVSDDTDPWRGGEVRTREANAGALLPWTRVRWNQAAMLAWHASSDAVACPACSPAVDARVARRAARVGWTLTTAKAYGYSISAEEGARLAATSEFTRRAWGSTGDATSVTLDARAYVRAWPRHGVIAVRGAFAASAGDDGARRTFSAGGSGPPPAGFNVGSDAIGLLRGFAEDSIAGPRAMTANLDYRFPLARIERGAGTLPLMLRTIHGAAFADVGHAWKDGFDRRDVRRAFGAELSFDIVAGYVLPFTLATGAAWRDDPVAGERGLVGFARIGRAF